VYVDVGIKASLSDQALANGGAFVNIVYSITKRQICKPLFEDKALFFCKLSYESEKDLEKKL